MESLQHTTYLVYGKFELILPDDNVESAEEVKQTLEALSTDMEAFEDILANVLNEDNVEPCQLSVPNPLNDTAPLYAEATEPQVENHEPKPQVQKRNEPETEPANTTATGPGRFKKLKTEDLVNIESNQYSEATKRNTQWGVRVFNGTNIYMNYFLSRFHCPSNAFFFWHK